MNGLDIGIVFGLFLIFMVIREEKFYGIGMFAPKKRKW